jgi:hypothetical protein
MSIQGLSMFIDWSCSDAIRIAVIAFSFNDIDVSELEPRMLPEDRDDYLLSLDAY